MNIEMNISVFFSTDFSKPISIGFYIEDEEHFSDQSLHPHEQS